MNKEERDKEYSEMIVRSISGDREDDHLIVENIILDLLRELGYVHTVKAFEIASEKFYYS